MIGIIDPEISAFCVIEKIRKIYPNINIYLYQDSDIVKGIDYLKKYCSIIISYKECDNIDVLSYKKINISNSYSLEDEELIEAIVKGDNDTVLNILSNLDISSDKIIILNNPKLLFIESIICNIFSNTIYSNVDYLLDEIDKIIKEKNINVCGEGLLNIIK